MKLNRQNTKKRRANNFPEIRKNKVLVNRRYSHQPKKKREKIGKIKKPSRRKRYVLKTARYRRLPKKKIKVILAILLAILVLLLGLIK